MNVKLNIEEDQKLRSVVRDLIKGQVKSIIRRELKAMVKEEFDNLSSDKFKLPEKDFKEVMHTAVRLAFPDNFRTDVRSCIEQIVTDSANFHAEQLIKKFAGQVVKDKFDDELLELLQRRVGRFNLVLSVEEKS